MIAFLLNPHFLLCFGIGWMITNGWAYVLMGVGTFLDIPWMMICSGAYLAFLWVPFTPEKIVTCFIAIGLLKLLYPNDTKTLGILREIRKKVFSGRKKAKKADRSQTGNPGGTDEDGSPPPVSQ